MGQILQKLLDVFYTKKLDIVVIGLENRYDIVCICFDEDAHLQHTYTPGCSPSNYYCNNNFDPRQRWHPLAIHKGIVSDVFADTISIRQNPNQPPEDAVTMGWVGCGRVPRPPRPVRRWQHAVR